MNKTEREKEQKKLMKGCIESIADMACDDTDVLHNYTYRMRGKSQTGKRWNAEVFLSIKLKDRGW